MTTNKQFIPTFTIEDASFFCRKKAERLDAYADFGFRILEDSSRQSDRVAALHEARSLDCEASVVCTGDTINVLQHFVDRMEVAFTERKEMWAAAEKKKKK
jgi:hypothetical protein